MKGYRLFIPRVRDIMRKSRTLRGCKISKQEVEVNAVP